MGIVEHKTSYSAKVGGETLYFSDYLSLKEFMAAHRAGEKAKKPGLGVSPSPEPRAEQPEHGEDVNAIPVEASRTIERARYIPIDPAPDRYIHIPPQWHHVSVEALNISIRALNGLKRGKFNTLGDLDGQNWKMLAAIQHVGRRSLQEIDDALGRLQELDLSTEDNADAKENGSSPMAHPSEAAPQAQVSTRKAPPVEVIENVEQFKQWIRVGLDTRGLEILYLRNQGLTLEEIGNRFEVTRERIRQLYIKKLRRLKSRVNRSPLMSALVAKLTERLTLVPFASADRLGQGIHEYFGWQDAFENASLQVEVALLCEVCELKVKQWKIANTTLFCKDLDEARTAIAQLLHDPQSNVLGPSVPDGVQEAFACDAQAVMPILEESLRSSKAVSKELWRLTKPLTSLASERTRKQLVLPEPVGRQREVLYLPGTGKTVVLGAAGSGKTTLAILRAAFLAKTSTSGGARSMLVAYNGNLVKFLQKLGRQHLDGVKICTFHHWAIDLLAFRYRLEKNQLRRQVAPDFIRTQAVRRAIESALSKFPTSTFLQLRPEVVQGEIKWLARMGIQTKAEFVQLASAGHPAFAMHEGDLDAIYCVYDLYRQKRAEMGFAYDWDDIAIALLNDLIEYPLELPLEHIVIDEGQDFSPIMLKCLQMAMRKDGSFTYFGDMVQQIYGRRLSWRDAGLGDASLWEFRENYRNPQPIAALAEALVTSGRIPTRDRVTPRIASSTGALPLLFGFASQAQELEETIKNIRLASLSGSTAVLCRHNSEVELFKKALKSHGIHVSAGTSLGMGVTVDSYYGAKGMEFDNVFLPSCSAQNLPSPNRAHSYLAPQEALIDEAAALYVAITRAKRRLMITYAGNPSPLLPLEPHYYEHSALWTN